METQRHRVGFLDRRAAGSRVWVVANPIAELDRETLLAALERFSETEAGKRVTALPDRSKSVWSAQWPPTALGVEDFPEDPDFPTIIDYLCKRTDAAPIQLVQGDEFLCVGIDHGLGDGFFILCVMAAMSHAATVEHLADGVAGPDARSVRYPMRLALLSLMRSPVSFTEAVRGTWRLRAMLAKRRNHVRVLPKTAGAAPAEFHSQGAVFACSANGFVDVIAAHRASQVGDPSLAAVVMVSICQAMRERKLAIADDIQVVADLRRYLPKGRWTASNFNAVTTLECGESVTSSEFTASIDAQVIAAAPLLTAAASRLGGRRFPRMHRVRAEAVEEAGQRAPLVLTFSDLTKLPVQRINWKRPNDAKIAVILPPGSPRHIAIGFIILGQGAVQVTASFYEGAVDRSEVVAALELALDGEHLR